MSETKARYEVGAMPVDGRTARLAAIRERAAARTPDRWRWRGNASGHFVYLGAIDRLHDYVLSFRRWGMQGTIPWFQRNPKESAGIARAKLIPRTHYDPHTIVGIDHPDARFIEHAPEDVDWLLSEVGTLRAAMAGLLGGVNIEQGIGTRKVIHSDRAWQEAVRAMVGPAVPEGDNADG